jgi:hypothetical protein
MSDYRHVTVSWAQWLAMVVALVLLGLRAEYSYVVLPQLKGNVLLRVNNLWGNVQKYDEKTKMWKSFEVQNEEILKSASE